MKVLIATISLLLLWNCAYADFPVVKQGDIQPGIEKLGEPIDVSKAGELTIASFNIRNLGTRQRSIKEYEALADLVDEADVVLFQEVGLGMFKGEGDKISGKESRNLKAITALFQVYLGNNWKIVQPPHPSGVKTGREINLLAHRVKGSGYDINGQWHEYIDLSEGKRKMAVFKLTLKKDDEEKVFLLGSVHLTPDDPERGIQMNKVADWLVAQQGGQAIAMGDFNWGYKKTSGIPAEQNFKGEDRMEQLHKEGKVFQLFAPLSYSGPGKKDKFRTNMGFRSSAFFYDQFLLTPPLADKLADGGKLLEDCGFIAFGIHSKFMKEKIESSEDRRGYGFNKYMDFLKKKGITQESFDKVHKDAVKDTQKKITGTSRDDATWLLSDHRVVWMQLKVF
jgi:endonuclease/exonuclease/phosphatase family metal-dependent hydrolase